MLRIPYPQDWRPGMLWDFQTSVTCMHVCVYMNMSHATLEPEENLVDSLLSFHLYVGPRDWTQVRRLEQGSPLPSASPRQPRWCGFVHLGHTRTQKALDLEIVWIWIFLSFSPCLSCVSTCVCVCVNVQKCVLVLVSVPWHMNGSQKATFKIPSSPSIMWEQVT